jgi:hypothetical protein|nr:MAG TPA: hypothetical protein [Caudoviricetes sp.]DAS98296.1 MAG TPA: hypothetical protein [Caudoviricetes sp.]
MKKAASKGCKKSFIKLMFDNNITYAIDPQAQNIKKLSF